MVCATELPRALSPSVTLRTPFFSMEVTTPLDTFLLIFHGKLNIPVTILKHFEKKRLAKILFFREVSQMLKLATTILTQNQ